MLTGLALIACAGAALGAQQRWYPHEGGLQKYRVNIRFGEEPEDTMPNGWKFGRVSAVATDSANNVYVFQRGKQADPLIVFDSHGKYLRSWGRGMFGNPHGLRIDQDDNVWVTSSVTADNRPAFTAIPYSIPSRRDFCTAFSSVRPFFRCTWKSTIGTLWRPTLMTSR